MIDGIYEIRFRGAADWGMGMLVFKDGMVAGSDIGGVNYDGKYSLSSDQQVSAHIIMTVPPGASLVQGIPPQPREYKLDFSLTIPVESFLNSIPVLIHLPPGPVNVVFSRLRAFE